MSEGYVIRYTLTDVYIGDTNDAVQPCVLENRREG